MLGKECDLESNKGQAGVFRAEPNGVALQASGLERDIARLWDTFPCCLHRKCARMGLRVNVSKL